MCVLPKLSCSELHLGANRLLQSPGLETLEEALPQCTALRALHLGESNANARGVHIQLEFIGKCSALHSLDLGQNNLQSLQLASEMPAMRELRLGTNSISPFGIKPRASKLQTWTQLSVLHLGTNELRDAGMKELCSTLSECPALRVLNVGQNRINPNGAAHLAKALATSSSITDLHLWAATTSGTRGSNGWSEPARSGCARDTSDAMASRARRWCAESRRASSTSTTSSGVQHWPSCTWAGTASTTPLSRAWLRTCCTARTRRRSACASGRTRCETTG